MASENSDWEPESPDPDESSLFSYGGDIPMAAQSRQWESPDPQLSSPLYRIPAEIRALIFEFALSETTLSHRVGANHDFDVRYDHAQAEDEYVPEPKPPVESTTPVKMTTRDFAFDAYPDIAFDELPVEHDPFGPGDDVVVHLPTREVTPDDYTWSRSCSLDGFDWLRPEYRGASCIFTALLSTCRLVYLETRHLPVKAKTFRFFMNRGPARYDEPGTIEDCFRALPPDQVREVRSLHLYTQLFWLETKLRVACEASAKAVLGRQPDCIRVLDQIENLRITIRRKDWWSNEDNWPLYLNPFSDKQDGSAVDMAQAIEDAQKDGFVQSGSSFSWASAFLSMPRLKKLVIDFETAEDKKAELERIVDWAQSWRFPVLRERQMQAFLNLRHRPTPATLAGVRHAYLSARATPVHKTSWRGLPYHWAHFCPTCGDSFFGSKECDACLRARRLIGEKKGPRLFVWTVTWTAEPDAGPPAAPEEAEAEEVVESGTPESTGADTGAGAYEPPWGSPGVWKDEEPDGFESQTSSELKMPAAPTPPMNSVAPRWAQSLPREDDVDWDRPFYVYF